MANGFLCTICGWQESLHTPRGPVGYEEEDRLLIGKPLDGFASSLVGCKGYAPSEEELALDKKYELKGAERGQPEGQH